MDCSLAVERLNENTNVPGLYSLFPFGRFMVRNRCYTPFEMPWFYNFGIPRGTADRWKNKKRHTRSLTEFLNSLPGYKVVRLSRPNVTTFKYIYQQESGQEKWDIVAITWIAHWARAAWEAGQYEELDCSFYVSRPFVYCAPQIIISNEGLPIGFIVTPTERATTYQWFHEDLNNATDTTFLSNTPYIVLSDEGVGLISFGLSKKEWKHFFCHAHLVRKWGAFGYLGMLISQILGLKTEKEYLELRLFFISIAHGFLEEGKVTLADYEAFVEFLPEKDFPHGLWLRIEDGVSTCSNHAERFHGVVKGLIKRANFLGLVHRLKKLQQAINGRYEAFRSNNREQLWHTVNELIALNAKKASECTIPDCVEFRHMMAKRFGTRTFPCRHTAVYWKDHATKGPGQVIPFLPSIQGNVKNEVVVKWESLFRIQATARKFMKFNAPDTSLIP
jgi:hypothetical protein